MPRTQEYCETYSYYRHRKPAPCMQESEAFIIFAVEARHLDYSSMTPLLYTIAKHPSDGSKNSDVGHAWIYLKSGSYVLEGGHTAETGEFQPRYLEGVSLLSDKKDPNPARYLFCSQADGCFEHGSGGHRPTYAAKVDLTPDQVMNILRFIENYPYQDYRLAGNSCASFVAEIAKLIGYNFECDQRVIIDQSVTFRGETVLLWTDPVYQEIHIATPDRLERSLIEAVEQGKAEYALPWYYRNKKECFKCRTRRTLKDLSLIPKRTLSIF